MRTSSRTLRKGYLLHIWTLFKLVTCLILVALHKVLHFLLRVLSRGVLRVVIVELRDIDSPALPGRIFLVFPRARGMHICLVVGDCVFLLLGQAELLRWLLIRRSIPCQRVALAERLAR